MGYDTSFYLQFVGCALFVAGCCLCLGNLSGMFPTYLGLGFLLGTLGITFWGTGLAMDESRVDD